MKKAIYLFLFLCFSSYGFSFNSNELRSHDLVKKANHWNTYTPDTTSFYLNSIENIVFDVISNTVTTQNVIPGKKLPFKLDTLIENLYSASCSIKYNLHQLVAIPFAKTDLIFPFHYHW